jgi:hypothetical protein
MKTDPIYQIGIFGLNPKKKLHEYKSYDLPVENLGLTFVRENGSIEKVTGNVKKVEVTDVSKNGTLIPVKVFIEVAHLSPVM